jgi:hypothetical protein
MDTFSTSVSTLKVVLVSSKREIGKDEMFGIAKSVHKLNGAVQINLIKV